MDYNFLPRQKLKVILFDDYTVYTIDSCYCNVLYLILKGYECYNCSMDIVKQPFPYSVYSFPTCKCTVIALSISFVY